MRIKIKEYKINEKYNIKLKKIQLYLIYKSDENIDTDNHFNEIITNEQLQDIFLIKNKFLELLQVDLDSIDTNGESKYYYEIHLMFEDNSIFLAYINPYDQSIYYNDAHKLNLSNNSMASLFYSRFKVEFTKGIKLNTNILYIMLNELGCGIL